MIAFSLSLLLTAAIVEGAAAPPFALSGGDATASAAPTPTLIAFLDLAEDIAGPSSTRGSSRAQADALISVVASFEGGLRAVVVDASSTLRGRDPRMDELLARVHDWGLDETPVIEDHEAAGLARRYGVTSTPSVFLLDRDGIVRGRWDRFVGPSELGIRLVSLRPDEPRP